MHLCSNSGIPQHECKCCRDCVLGRDGSPSIVEIRRQCEIIRSTWPEHRIQRYESNNEGYEIPTVYEATDGMRRKSSGNYKL